MAVDGDGNTIIVGVVYRPVDFGGGLLTAKGGSDIALVKLGP